MRKYVLAVTAAAALASAAALAQTMPNTANPGPDAGNPSAMKPPANVVMPAPLKASDFLQLPSSDMLSSNVVGLDVYDGQRNDIGKIKDIAFDSSKKMTAYIVGVGGFLGMGTRYVAVSPEAVAVQYDTNNKSWRASMNATKDQLKAAPEFVYGGQWAASKS